MARAFSAVIAACLLMQAASIHAEEQDQARGVIEKAIHARGGADRLAKIKAIKYKSKGTVHVGGQDAEYKGEFTIQFPDQTRSEIDTEFGSQAMRIVVVLNRDKGWMKFGDQSQEMPDDQLKSQRDEVFANYLTTLTPLLNKDIKITVIPDAKVNDKPADGVSVTAKDHKEIKLYFDKDSHLLIKREMQSNDGMGNDVKQESFYSDYKEIDGIKQPMKLLVKRDGEPFLDGTVSEFKVLDKVEAKDFNEP
jgi:outer membrane lipoprotein-sorting protein